MSQVTMALLCRMLFLYSVSFAVFADCIAQQIHTTSAFIGYKKKSSAGTRDYITGDGFRKYADYIIENSACSFNPGLIEPSSIIYVEVGSLGYFFSTVFPQIKNQIILISHNGDMSAPGNYASYLDDQKIIMWFGQNCDTVGHPKFCPIPIGLANAKRIHGNTLIFDSVLNVLKTDVQLQQKSRLYVNLKLGTNPIRGKLYQFFKNKSFATLTPKKKDVAAYLYEMAQHRYTLSPFGNGLDCHRTWEALLVGSIPVVQTSTLDPLYSDLPVIIVQEWHEVTINFLEEKYKEMQLKKFNRKKLFMPYWLDIIENCRLRSCQH